MPVVSVRYKTIIREHDLVGIIPALRNKLAEQLTCEVDGKTLVITPQMVKIRFDKASKLDTTMPDLHIEIEARAFESRLKYAEAYAEELASTLTPLLPKGTRFSVWYKRCRAGWSAGQA
jgi:hypothetical protein